jgi:hypothetical protein
MLFGALLDAVNVEVPKVTKVTKVPKITAFHFSSL